MKIALIILATIVVTYFAIVFILRYRTEKIKVEFRIKKSKFHNAWEVVIDSGKRKGAIVKRFNKKHDAISWINRNENKPLIFKR